MTKNALKFFLFFLLLDQVLPALHVLLSNDFHTPWIKLSSNLYFWLFLLLCMFWYIAFLFTQKSIFQFQKAIFHLPFLVSGKHYRFWIFSLSIGFLIALGFAAGGMNNYRYSALAASDPLVLLSSIFRALAFGFLMAVAVWRMKCHTNEEFEFMFKRHRKVVILAFLTLLLLVSGTQDVLFLATVAVIILVPSVATAKLFQRRIKKVFFFLPMFGIGAFIFVVGLGESVKRELGFARSIEYVFSNSSFYVSWLIERYSTYHYSAMYWLTEQVASRTDFAANWHVFTTGAYYRFFKLFGADVERPEVQILGVVNYLNIHPYPKMGVGASAGVFGTPLMLFSFWTASVFIGFYMVFVLAPTMRTLKNVHLNILGLFLMWILLRPFLLDPLQILITGTVPIMFVMFFFALNYLETRGRRYA